MKKTILLSALTFIAEYAWLEKRTRLSDYGTVTGNGESAGGTCRTN